VFCTRWVVEYTGKMVIGYTVAVPQDTAPPTWKAPPDPIALKPSSRQNVRNLKTGDYVSRFPVESLGIGSETMENDTASKRYSVTTPTCRGHSNGA